MSAMKTRMVIAMAVCATAIAGPAYADKVICDGNLFCLIGLVPILAVGVAAQALTPDPPERSAAQAIKGSDMTQLKFVLQMHPELLKDAGKAHGLLLAAAEAGNLAATTLLLDEGVPANTGNSRVLWYATTVEEIEVLLAHGANADEMDLGSLVYRLRSPIVVDLVGTLLSHRTVLSPNDPGALNLLNAVIRENQLVSKLPLVNLLLQRGVNPTGPPDMSALVQLAFFCIASDAACVPIAQELIKHGAEVNMGCRWTPLQAARNARNAPLIALLESAGATDQVTAQEARCAIHKNR